MLAGSTVFETRVVDSYFDTCGTGVQTGHGGYIIGNYIRNSTGTGSSQAGIVAAGGTSAAGPLTIIRGNTLESGDNYGIRTGGLVLCEGNQLHNNADSGIFIDSNGGKYIDNTINQSGFYGIETSLSNDTKGGLIQGNRIYLPQRHGMFIDMPNFRIFDNLVFGAGAAAADTYDAIHIDHDHAYMSRNTIDGNSGQTRYGINVAAGADSIAVGNDMGDVGDYGTAPFNGSIILSHPDDATYGDNFVSGGS